MAGTRRTSEMILWAVTLLLLSASVLYAEGRKVKKYVTPDYPIIAIKMRVEGVVMLKAAVARDGSVENVEVVSGHPLLRNAAADSVKQWEFESSAAKTEEVVAVTFKLPR